MTRVDSIKIAWSPILDNWTISTTTTNLSYVCNAQIDKQVGNNADSFTFKLYDPNGTYRTQFSNGDYINIYSSTDAGSTWTSEITGWIRTTSANINVDTPYVVISGLNRLERLLGFITPVSGAANKRSADTWIRQILREVNTQNGAASYSGGAEPTSVTINPGYESRYIYGGLLSEWTTAGNDVITQSGLLTDQGFVRGDQVAFELIETLSTTDYAGVNHGYFLDANNYFHWVPYNDNSSGPISTYQQETTLGMQSYDTYNYFIIYGGKNLYNTAGIKDFRYDIVQCTRDGIKAKVVYDTGAGEKVKSEMERALRDQAKYSDAKFPFATAYPFSPPANWGDSSVCNNDSDMNSRYVKEVLVRIRSDAEKLLFFQTKRGFTLQRRATPLESIYLHVLGGYYADGVSGKMLRCNRISKTFDLQNGWVVNEEMAEDVNKVFQQ